MPNEKLDPIKPLPMSDEVVSQRIRFFDIMRWHVRAEDKSLSNEDMIEVVFKRWKEYCRAVAQP